MIVADDHAGMMAGSVEVAEKEGARVVSQVIVPMAVAC